MYTSYKEHGAPFVFAKEEKTLDKLQSHTGINDQHIQTSNPLKTHTSVVCSSFTDKTQQRTFNELKN